MNEWIHSIRCSTRCSHRFVNEYETCAHESVHGCMLCLPFDILTYAKTHAQACMRVIRRFRLFTRTHKQTPGIHEHLHTHHGSRVLMREWVHSRGCCATAAEAFKEKNASDHAECVIHMYENILCMCMLWKLQVLPSNESYSHACKYAYSCIYIRMHAQIASSHIVGDTSMHVCECAGIFACHHNTHTQTSDMLEHLTRFKVQKCWRVSALTGPRRLSTYIRTNLPVYPYSHNYLYVNIS